MRDAQTVVPPIRKVVRNYSIKPVTREVIDQHAHVYYDGNASMALDFIVKEWRELRAAKESGRIKVVNP